jgi:hypothetical protein
MTIMPDIKRISKDIVIFASLGLLFISILSLNVILACLCFAFIFSMIVMDPRILRNFSWQHYNSVSFINKLYRPKLWKNRTFDKNQKSLDEINAKIADIWDQTIEIIHKYGAAYYGF